MTSGVWRWSINSAPLLSDSLWLKHMFFVFRWGKLFRGTVRLEFGKKAAEMNWNQTWQRWLIFFQELKLNEMNYRWLLDGGFNLDIVNFYVGGAYPIWFACIFYSIGWGKTTSYLMSRSLQIGGIWLRVPRKKTQRNMTHPHSDPLPSPICHFFYGSHVRTSVRKVGDRDRFFSLARSCKTWKITWKYFWWTSTHAHFHLDLFKSSKIWCDLLRICITSAPFLSNLACRWPNGTMTFDIDKIHFTETDWTTFLLGNVQEVL